MKFDILKIKKFSFGISGALVAISVVLLGLYGLKPGIDFVGGSLMEISFENTAEMPSVEAVRTFFDTQSIEGSVQVQKAGDDSLLIKLPFLAETEHMAVRDALVQAYKTDTQNVVEKRFETIGPAISAQLRQRAVSITIAVMLAIIFFIAYTFRKVSKPLSSWKYGTAAIIALMHDIIITLGVFAVLGKFMGVEVDIAFIVALMTILGYSVNDTIVVFDRIRENLLKRGADRFNEAVIDGVKDTVVRSVNTSLTTLLVLGALYFFGGTSIKYFSLALIIGIIFGTYSSIFLASPLLVVWNDYTHKKK